MPRIGRSRASVSDYEDIGRYVARDNPAAPGPPDRDANLFPPRSTPH
jgi:hypothetical protein